MSQLALDLSIDEQRRLAEHEAVIERGLNTFYEVGMALLDIRDSRLYRLDYGTFEEYCQRRWDLKQAQAYRLMDAAKVTENLKVLPMGELPTVERQARELAPLAPDEQRLVWDVVQQTAPLGKVTAAHVKSVVNVLKEVTATGAIDDGSGEQIPIATATVAHVKAAVLEETYERMARQEIHIAESLERRIDPDTGEVSDGRQKPKTNRAGDEYVPQGYDACQTPPEAIDPLLPYLPREWRIWEPAAGEGLLVDALYDSDFHSVLASDILTGQNFFEYEPDEAWDALVTNPPYSIKYKWLARCYALGKPFALLLPVETLGAKQAQELFREYGLEVVFLDRRVNFKMPYKGWDGGGAQFPVAWFTRGLDIGQQMTFARMDGQHE